MHYENSPLIIKRLFSEIYGILRNTERNVNEIWQDISEIKFLKRFQDNEYEIYEFIGQFDFLSIEDGNYSKRKYIAIDKIKFICDAIKHLSLDLRDLSGIIDYGGFEALIAEILSINGFYTIKNFRFSDKSYFKNPIKNTQKRYEIDVIGIQGKYILVIDAKHWRKKDSFSAINNAANMQYQRVLALKENPEIFSKLIQHLLGVNPKIKKQLPFILIPMMITLENNNSKMNDNQVPLVSIYYLNSFLQELPLNTHYCQTIKIKKVNIQTQLKIL